MPPGRSSLGNRSWSGLLLALCASCLWGCPQLLSDDWLVGTASDPSDPDPALLDMGNGSGGSAGAAGSAGSGAVANAGAGAAGTGGTPGSRPGAPSVVSVSPSNGATGVAAEASITVTFSEPMDTDSVRLAYGSTELPPAAVSFNWSDGNTVLQITPNQPLTLASGSDAAATVAKTYAFAIGASAVDQTGEALPAFSSSFSTLREIRQTLAALQDRSLSGNWRSDNVYGDNSCQLSDADHTMCVGDSSNANSSYRGLLTFDLSALPAPTRELSSAQLNMTIDLIRGSPFPALGGLLAEHVKFDSISLVAYDAAAIGSAINVSSSATTGAQLSVNVLSSVQADLPARGYSQFRLRFSIDTNSDLNGDLIEVLGNTEKLAVTCLMP